MINQKKHHTGEHFNTNDSLKILSVEFLNVDSVDVWLELLTDIKQHLMCR